MKIKKFLVKEEWGKIALVALFLMIFFVSGILVLVHDRAPKLNTTEIERIEASR